MTDQKPFRFQFFLPEARVMSDREVESLPADKVQSASAAGKDGLWIELTCPDRSCLTADGRLNLPAAVAKGSEKKGIFLNLFCPEGACEIVESTDAP